MGLRIGVDVHIERPKRGEGRCIVDKVRDWIEEIEAGYPSPIAWRNARRVFEHLARQKELTPKQSAVFKILEPVMRRYGHASGVKTQATYPHERGADGE